MDNSRIFVTGGNDRPDNALQAILSEKDIVNPKLANVTPMEF